MTGKRHILVVGATGGVGAAFVRHYLSQNDVALVHAAARDPAAIGPQHDRLQTHHLDYAHMATMASLPGSIARLSPRLDGCVVATGLLHDGSLAPEKHLKEVTVDNLARAFAVNASGPIGLLRSLEDLLHHEHPSWFGALSARVGSISDNRLGGWYAYRASKAALNMLLKTAAVELARRCPRLTVAALHPGTVDTSLSQPYSGRVEHEIFSTDDAAQKLVRVMEGLGPEKSGGFFDYAGKVIRY